MSSPAILRPNGKPFRLRAMSKPVEAHPAPQQAPMTNLGEHAERIIEAARRRYAMYAKSYRVGEFDAELFASCVVRVAKEMADPTIIVKERRRRMFDRSTGRVFEAFAR